MRNGQDDCTASTISHSRANELQSRFLGYSLRASLALFFVFLTQRLELPHSLDVR